MIYTRLSYVEGRDCLVIIYLVSMHQHNHSRIAAPGLSMQFHPVICELIMNNQTTYMNQYPHIHFLLLRSYNNRSSNQYPCTRKERACSSPSFERPVMTIDESTICDEFRTGKQKEYVYAQDPLKHILALVELVNDLFAKAILWDGYICFCFIYHLDQYPSTSFSVFP